MSTPSAIKFAPVANCGFRDAFDFFTVSLTVSDLAETFEKTNSQITWGITLVLMLRSIGAIIFGVWYVHNPPTVETLRG